jgi:hypothetical protein
MSSVTYHMYFLQNWWVTYDNVLFGLAMNGTTYVPQPLVFHKTELPLCNAQTMSSFRWSQYSWVSMMIRIFLKFEDEMIYMPGLW